MWRAVLLGLVVPASAWAVLPPACSTTAVRAEVLGADDASTARRMLCADAKLLALRAAMVEAAERDEAATRPAAAKDNVKPAAAGSSLVSSRESVSVEVSLASALLSREFVHGVSAADVASAAGTFGDPSRYMQLLAGVVSDSDERNDFLVRGGNPEENLFVIDGIDVPSINHLALADTTGGFVSMIENDAVQRITLHSGVYDAAFADRLSSVVEIGTVPEGRVTSHETFEVGLAGVGFTSTRPLGDRGSMFVSGRQSVLNLFTNDIGLNGVPKYTNMLLRADEQVGPRDRVWGMSLTGVDSIAIRPSAGDTLETSTFDIDYNGWRNTSGVNWQHTLGAKAYVTTTVSNAEQAQTIVDKDQLLADEVTYSERSHDGETTVKSEWTGQPRSWLVMSAGGALTDKRADYHVAQPVPLPNPYSASPVSANTTGVAQQFSKGVEAGFAQGTLLLPAEVRVTLGERVNHWGFGEHTTLSPRALVSVPVAGHLVSVGYAEYAQMPPYLYLLAFAQNASLKPIRAEHLTADLDVLHARRASVTLAAYRKLYFDYPVASAYPQLSLANIADTFGQSFLQFPMQSSGRGRVEGVELTSEWKPSSRVRFDVTGAYARAWYSGLDGVLRRGNYDIPLTANVLSLIRAGKGSEIAVRFSGASGRPYTPDDLVASTAQDRDVYALNQINLERSRAYERLDVRFQHEQHVRVGQLLWNVGMLNVLDRRNFYDNVWVPRAQPAGTVEQDQLGRFPEGAVKLTF